MLFGEHAPCRAAAGGVDVFNWDLVICSACSLHVTTMSSHVHHLKAIHKLMNLSV